MLMLENDSANRVILTICPLGKLSCQARRQQLQIGGVGGTHKFF